MSETDNMSLGELLDRLVKYSDEHDLDCEETEMESNDRCPACLAREARARYLAGTDK